MAPIVEIRSLTKTYGRLTAVRAFDLDIEEGTVFGLIGPNGAGKSTILKMLATILRPSGGSARVAGHSVVSSARRVREQIGYMPDVFGVYEDMLVEEYLQFFSSAYGIRASARPPVIAQVLDLTNLTGKRDAMCRSLSRGMTQRLSLARVLLHDPKVLFLDEPASGLDPRARIEFKDLVFQLKRTMGKTVIISSHILSELEEMCDSIAILEQGALVHSGTVEEATGQVDAHGAVFRVRVLEEPDEGRTIPDLIEVIRSRPYHDAVREAEGGAILVRFAAGFGEFHLLNADLVGRGWKVQTFTREKTDLEDAFMRLTQGVVQ